MVYVDKVHYAKDSYGNELYISEVMWTDSLYENAWKRCSKADMIRFINANPGHAQQSMFEAADGAMAKKFTLSITDI